ncbi:hypothetical protein OC842_004906 [Tilletia horrida]|uniref:Uncharacterized protein n=1 Tax=Tilletia horrida TaxID=155126 RepID=A0AAN6JPU9_9BASI|nr:hypothetical protein OC842_004906 [Tilletia horrida]
MAAPIRRNQDGTVDLSSVHAHVAHLKGKYAQNAANYERNTGHKLSFDAAPAAAAAAGGGEGAESSSHSHEHSKKEEAGEEEGDAAGAQGK